MEKRRLGFSLPEIFFEGTQFYYDKGEGSG